MNFYIAIDHTSEHNKAWSYMKFEPGLTEKLTVREIRNWLIRHMKDLENVWCVHIMKRTKKDTYKSVELVKPDGCSYETNDNMGFVHDFHFSDNNTIKM